MAKLAPSLLDACAEAVVAELHARSRAQLMRNAVPLAGRLMRARLRGRAWGMTGTGGDKDWLADKLVALDPAKAALCHMLCRSIGARRVVEAGTSHGVSTIYLAAAVRDTLAAEGGEGLVIGAEHEPRKVASARRNLRRAGLEDHAEIREGDLRETLRGLEGPVDFMLIDLWIPMALPALDLVTPVLRPGALVICDKVISGRRGYAEYLARVRDPDGPFVSVTIPGRGGLEISMKR